MHPQLLNLNADILLKTVHAYIAMQKASYQHLPYFLNIGVTDWRLTKIPDYYQALIHQAALLKADGLTNIEIKQLSQLTTQLISLCEQLSAYPIPATFSHSDFNDKNILIHPQTQQTTLVDLSEVEITHPFFSLHNFLHQIKENYSLNDEFYHLIEQQILQPWLQLITQEQLLETMALIQQCWPIHRAFTVYRLLTSIDSNSPFKLLGQGKLAKSLRLWLAQ